MMNHENKSSLALIFILITTAVFGAQQSEGNIITQANIKNFSENLEVECWNIFQLKLDGPQNGNPFIDVVLVASFENDGREYHVKGFYDGHGSYIVRFMPGKLGEWRYTVKSNKKALDGLKGSFTCVAAAGQNHGPVRVRNLYHFAYEDGTPFNPFGTTCYAWIHQPEEIQTETLETLKNAPFNKIRMCVFPKWYEFNHLEPELYPYQGTPPDNWNFSKFNPEFFHHLEKRISQLNELGIECDLILFHPYDKGHWGFDRMSDEQDNLYLRYIIARLSSFQNIWWSVANEYDFMDYKQKEDWDRFFKIIKEEDPYDHLRSIHNGVDWYDHSNPLVTHLSVQCDPWEDGGIGEGPQKIDEWKATYKKPVIIDEMKYEGNIRYSYGDLTAKEMTARFWYVLTKAAYATHGETYLHENDIMWWAKGGKLYGQSPERISFLRKIIEDAPREGLTIYNKIEEDGNAVCSGEKYFLFYFGARQPAERWLVLPQGKKYKVDIIDTWRMNIQPLENYISGKILLNLPGKPYIAVRAIQVE